MTCYMMHTTCLHFVAGSILAHCQCIMKTKAFKRSRSHDFLQVPNEYAYTSLPFYVHKKQPSTVQIEVLVWVKTSKFKMLLCVFCVEEKNIVENIRDNLKTKK